MSRFFFKRFKDFDISDLKSEIMVRAQDLDFERCYNNKIVRNMINDDFRAHLHVLGTQDKTIMKDLRKIQFDWENYEVDGFKTLLNGLDVMMATVGGDWECPITIVIYHDGKKLRGYIPGNGNPYNTDLMMAYGNNTYSEYNGRVFNNYESRKANKTNDDRANCIERFGIDYERVKSDVVKIEADICNRIQYKEEE